MRTSTGTSPSLVGPTNGVEQQAVADLQRALLQILMRSMDWVARLEADNRAPASRHERCPHLRGGQRVPGRQAVQRLDLGPDRTGNRQGGRAEDPGDTRVG